MFLDQNNDIGSQEITSYANHPIRTQSAWNVELKRKDTSNCRLKYLPSSLRGSDTQILSFIIDLVSEGALCAAKQTFTIIVFLVKWLILFQVYPVPIIDNMSLTVPNIVPQRPFCYLNFISMAKPQKFGNETYDAHVLASSKTYRKQNKPKKWIPNPLRYMSFWKVCLIFRKNFEFVL